MRSHTVLSALPAHRPPKVAGLRVRREADAAQSTDPGVDEHGLLDPEPDDLADTDLSQTDAAQTAVPDSAAPDPAETDPEETDPEGIRDNSTIDLRKQVPGAHPHGEDDGDGDDDGGGDWAAAGAAAGAAARVDSEVALAPAPSAEAVGAVGPHDSADEAVEHPEIEPDVVAVRGTGWLEIQDAIEMLQQAHDGLLPSAPLRQVVEELVGRLGSGCQGDVALLRGDDDEGWHVVAGSGLRTLEVRPLASLPPLLGRLDAACPVLTVAETDTVRGELAGLPLSRHHSLLVLRHPHDLVTIVGRAEPFDQRDVDQVTHELSEALPLLRRGWRTESLLLGLVDWFEGEARST